MTHGQAPLLVQRTVWLWELWLVAGKSLEAGGHCPKRGGRPPTTLVRTLPVSQSQGQPACDGPTGPGGTLGTGYLRPP